MVLTSAIAEADSLGERLAGRQSADADRALVQFLSDGAKAGLPAAYIVAVKKTSGLDPRVLDKWAAIGVSVAVNLKRDAWILRVAVSKDESANQRMMSYLKNTVGAVVLFPYVKEYKTTADVLAGTFRFDKEIEASGNNMMVEFFPGTDASAAERIVAQFHTGQVPSEHMGGLTWQLRIPPQRAVALAALDQVYLIEPVMTRRPLMNETRADIDVDAVQNFNWSNTIIPPVYDLSGLGIRMSTGEGLATQHRDFHQDLADTVARWTGCVYDDAHGAMTAGIMLGDGSGSAAGGADAPYKWRGVAPNATFVCPGTNPVTALPDVMNASSVETYWGVYDLNARFDDAETRGDNGLALRVPHIRSAGNNGNSPPQYDTVSGYYSILGPSKNSIGVGNVDDIDFRTQGTATSLGWTFDNRIKPDLAAPGTGVIYVGSPSGIDFDFAYIRVLRPMSTVMDWTFSTGAYYGWGQNLNLDLWWTLGDFTLTTLSSSTCAPGNTPCLRAHMNGLPWVSGHNRPIFATFKAANTTTTEDLNILPSASDSVEIKYRVRQPQDRDIALTLIFGDQLINDPDNSANYYTLSGRDFPIVADGGWHIVTIPIGGDANWMAKALINYVGIQYAGGPGMRVPTVGGAAVYGNASGTSASGPVVAGVAALMLEKMTRTPLNVVMANHSAWSPYYRAAPSNGAPLPSTIKALLVQSAKNLAFEPHITDLPNPDTGTIMPYYAPGPNPNTGYGLVDAKAAIDLITLDAAAAPGAKIIYEDQFTMSDVATGGNPGCSTGCPWGYREYNVVVPPGRTLPLLATLAYDDPPGGANPDAAIQVSPRLVDQIGLEARSPTGQVYRPWTVDPFYTPASLPADAPENLEPQPIVPSAVKPARRDQINDRDNIKQVRIDFPAPGTWKFYVTMDSYGLPPPQTYSLVLDGAKQPPANDLTGGKVVFASAVPGTFGSTQQLFVKNVSGGPPVQITNGYTNAYDPSWSYDGNHIVHISDAGLQITWVHIWIFWIPIPSWKQESIDIRSPSGTLQASYATQSFTGFARAKYPDFSPDGRQINITSLNDWSALQIQLITFSGPYNFGSAAVSPLVPTNFTGHGDDPGDGEFSKDGKFVYFNANADNYLGRVYKVNVLTGAITQIYGDGAPLRRAYAVSVSPDGQELVYNSELYKDNVANQIDEELMSVGLLTGAITQVLHESGNQYARYPKNGVGGEMLLQSNATPTGPYYLYLLENGTRTLALNPAQPVEGGDDWWKPL